MKMDSDFVKSYRKKMEGRAKAHADKVGTPFRKVSVKGESLRRKKSESGDPKAK